MLEQTTLDTSRLVATIGQQKLWGRPHPRVRPLLEGDYIAYLSTGATPRRFLIPATTSLALIIKLDEAPDFPPGFLNGLARGTPCLIEEGTCAHSSLEVWMNPLAAYQVFGLPLAEVAGQFVDFADLPGDDTRWLVERVREARTWRQRFSVIDAFLLNRLNRSTKTICSEVEWVWKRLLNAGGRIRIHQAATEVGWSHKHLITKFRQQIGLTPKYAARLIRFDEALMQLHWPARPCVDDIAISCGYADQAHLLREIREFTSVTLTEFRQIPLRPTPSHISRNGRAALMTKRPRFFGS